MAVDQFAPEKFVEEEKGWDWQLEQFQWSPRRGVGNGDSEVTGKLKRKRTCGIQVHKKMMLFWQKENYEQKDAINNKVKMNKLKTILMLKIYYSKLDYKPMIFKLKYP